jgi:hypothetical protein
MNLHEYHNVFFLLFFVSGLLTCRPATSVNRERQCHHPVTKQGVINEGKDVDSVKVQVCAVIYTKPLTNLLIIYASAYGAFIRLNECVSLLLRRSSKVAMSDHLFTRAQI